MLKISGYHPYKNLRISCMNDRDILFFAVGSTDAANLSIFFSHSAQLSNSSLKNCANLTVPFLRGGANGLMDMSLVVHFCCFPQDHIHVPCPIARAPASSPAPYLLIVSTAIIVKLWKNYYLINFH
jgi:hypothetical protein